MNHLTRLTIALLVAALGACSSSDSSDGNSTGTPVAQDTPSFPQADGSVVPSPEDTTVDPTPDTAVDPAPDTTVDPTPEVTQDPTPDAVVDPTPDSAVPPTPDVTEDPTPDATPDAAPDAAPPEPVAEVRFVALGDVGEGNENQYEVAAAIQAKCAAEGCDFAILLGDNVYDAGVSSIVDSQWEEKFEAPYENLDFPFYAVLGNHDNGGLFSDVFGDTFDGAGGEFEKGDIQVAYTDVSSKWTMPARTYDFISGPAHFVALDTNDMMWAEFFDEAKDRAETQVAEFPAKIDASEVPWKIVMGHHPYISNGAHGNAGEYEGLDEDVMEVVTEIPFLGDLLEGIGEIVLGEGVKENLEAILCDRVDIYMSGHDHNRQWLSPTSACPGVHFVVSGAGAKTKHLGGTNPTDYEDASIGGFLYVHIAGDTLNAQFIDQNGVVNFEKTLQK